ncbi:L-dopachrome tautomerase-related protein [Tenacibaculum agarivorans]|uniref:L-dopachrome tautomerase-related protein n=1 Tax=Tenacibaculum agarivorans TaxID=1908389 RepID=UPI00094B9D41|nr:L-dopachrome tautomerase-related protein [Tenacibaculum agarivorans]
MKNFLFTLAVFCLFSACKSEKQKTKVEQTNIKPTTEVQKEAEIVFSSQDIRPGNLALTTNGRLFVSMNPLVSPKTKVFELNSNDKNTGTAYPNATYATGDDAVFKAVIGIRADSKGNLWLLDMGTKQFIVWNTNTNELVKTIPIPVDVVVSTSFLQDFIIDEKHNRVIIADMTQGDLKSAPIPAFIVIDTETGAAKRMAQSHPSMMPEVEGGFALNPIAIDPNFKYVYFGALNGRTIYRVSAASFDNEEQLKKDIEKFGTKSFCDGIAVDANENVYITNIEKSEIGVFNKKDGFKTLAKLPEGQSWPDGLYIASNGYVYATVDQLNRIAALNKGKDESTGPYLVVRTQLLR